MTYAVEQSWGAQTRRPPGTCTHVTPMVLGALAKDADFSRPKLEFRRGLVEIRLSACLIHVLVSTCHVLVSLVPLSSDRMMSMQAKFPRRRQASQLWELKTHTHAWRSMHMIAHTVHVSYSPISNDKIKIKPYIETCYVMHTSWEKCPTD